VSLLDRACLIACSSLRDPLAAAQRAMGTRLPVLWLDERLHRDPRLMREAILQTLETLPAQADTLLVCMGFCGGSWAEIKAPRRLVMPRADDCVSILLHTSERSGYNLKEPGHLYVKGPDPQRASFAGIFARMTAGAPPEQRRIWHERWKASYCSVDIIDTGLYDCRSKAYRRPVLADAAFLEAETATVPGSTKLLEALVSGQWDERFRTFEPGETITEEALRARG